MIPTPPPGFEQTIDAVAACDISKAAIRIVYEDYLQSDVIRISDLGALSDEKFRCLRRAVHPFYILEIEPEDQRSAYYEVDRRESRRLGKAEAIEWFRSRGMLALVPLFDPKSMNVNQYITRVEMFCGYLPGSTLEKFELGFITMKREAFSFPVSDEAAAKFECLIKTMAAADLEEHGLSFGFLGNEAFADEGS